jgi:hypothetical protein
MALGMPRRAGRGGQEGLLGETMTLELKKVASQIEDMGRELAKRAGRQQRALPAARELLRLYAHRQAELGQVAESDPGQRLRCASPGEEALDAIFVTPDLPEHVTT